MTEVFPVTTHTRVVRAGEEIVIYYPEVVGLADPAWQRTVNTMIVKQAQDMIDEQVAGDISTVNTLIGQYELKNNQRNIFSLTQSNYLYRMQAAHGMTILRSLTFDMSKHRVYTLKDLFKPSSPYVERLSAIVAQQIKERDIGLLSPFTGIAADQSFYIADKTLVLYFQLYELTPYVFGFPFFPISVYELSDIIDEDGPLGIMAANI
ncbi:DUF3298 and DUF4163 domain-containing protein [Paenibacillus camelliae]|uniref:DUF3298 and DUF4163 domain-containing protein n=1 Tax=Paenibacillus camelliae TaxID=512410 RepID=UPI00203EE6E3|nr:DUF3298 and DUF4163 domain-containing protein [Paenibacillus camelliae]MCM3633301.1 DUF3298 and DUF4163 domain-containing protein [Paenibacillus camelliae]